MRQLNLKYEDIVSIEDLLDAWKEFKRGKIQKRDVIEFNLHLMDNLIQLHRELASLTYTHHGYYAFNISDPKPRNIHKAIVKDRLLHHAIYQKIYPFFDSTFIYDSYSCRKEKGTHIAMERFKRFIYKVSKNNTKQCWVLKCDVKKFFASIDHLILFRILKSYISDENILWLIVQVVRSFTGAKEGVGLPLGNLTSQLLVNVYMNEFDKYIKHVVKAKYYIRYADDFVILSEDRDGLLELTPKISDFLKEELGLSLHPDKVLVRSISSGVDFLGWVHFPDHRILRTVTKKRMIKKMKHSEKEETTQSYLGMLSHGNAKKLEKKIKSEILAPK